MSTSYGATPPENDPAARGAGESRPPVGRDGDPVARDRDPVARDRESVVAREKEEYGGIKIGSAFFGWLTATGTAVLLTALAAAAGTVFGLNTTTDVQDAAEQATENAETIGIVGGIVLLVILFVAYYCGGYVAGRMARFDGAKQGLAVWLWAVVIAIVLALLGLVAGSQYNVLSQLNAFPQIPVSASDLTTGGVIALVAAAVVSLVGAILGGLSGMRFHRKVDMAGLGT
jgi:amino acid transporter